MYKYRVTFETRYQVDGFTDWRDLEYRSVRKVMMVEAKNLKHAERVALLKKPRYYCSGRINGWFDWNRFDIKKVTKVKKVAK
jgi:hypothetical protein